MGNSTYLSPNRAWKASVCQSAQEADKKKLMLYCFCRV